MPTNDDYARSMKEQTLPCLACGAKMFVKGFRPLLHGILPHGKPITFMVLPKRVKQCLSYGSIRRLPCGHGESICRSGLCTSREDAIRQWNGMIERMAVKGAKKK